MTHGDDDGLRVPPIIAPQQIVIVPMLRDQLEDEDILAYCSEIVADLSRLSVFGEPVRALLDKKAIKRSAEHTSGLQSLMLNTYAVFSLQQTQIYNITENK